MRYLILAGALIFSVFQASGQATTKVRVIKGDDVNFTELANYFHDHPTAHVRKKMFDEDGDKEERPTRPAPDPSLVKMIHGAESARGAESPHSALLPASPAPADTFQSSISDYTSIPPDTHGAVDSNYCVSAINDSITIRTKAGAYVSGASLDNFWSSLETFGTGAYDPRIHYDPNMARWIFVTDCYGETVNSTIFVAVSATSNPTGTWHMYSLYVGDAAGDWLDFPCVGFNSKWVAVSGNIFSSSGSYNNDVIYAFNYSDLRSGVASPAYTELLPASLDPNSFCISPALTYDATEQNLYGMEVYDGSSGKLEEWKISGPVNSPTLSIVANPSTTTHWQYEGAGGSDFAPQLGSTRKLQTNDDRINNLQQRNGNLWCAHTAFLPATGTVTHCGAMWWEIDTTGTPVQNGLLAASGSSVTSSTPFYAFPSIAVNANNDALMGFAYLSSQVHPSAAYTLHMHTDPNDSMRPAVVYRHGQKMYYETFGGSDDRWGDYSSTCVDPSNNVNFWTIQESVPNWATPDTLWDTWWASVQTCATLSAPASGSTSTTQCASTTATYSVAAVTGATGYTWTVAGSGWSGTSTTTSIALTAGTGVATVTAAANNSCGAGTPYTFTVTAIALPSTPTITTVTAPCVGSSSATFSTTATSATSYNWTILGSGWSGTSTTGSITTTVGAGTGTIIVSGTNTCGTGPADTLLSTPGTVPSMPTAIDSSATLCSGSTITFSTPAVSGATSYTWAITGTGWSSTASTSNSINATVGTGSAIITVTPVNACGSGTPYTISAVTPVITPTVSFTEAAHITTTGTTDLISYSGSTVSGATYTWNFDGGTATPGGSSVGTQSVSWTTTGLKTVSLTVTNDGCTSAVYTDTVLVNNPAAVPQVIAAQVSATILPNPNDGTFNISFSTAVNVPVTVKIIDMAGRTAYVNQYNAPGDKLSVVTQNMSTGVYNVNIEIDGQLITDKITVTR